MDQFLLFVRALLSRLQPRPSAVQCLIEDRVEARRTQRELELTLAKLRSTLGGALTRPVHVLVQTALVAPDGTSVRGRLENAATTEGPILIRLSARVDRAHVGLDMMAAALADYVFEVAISSDAPVRQSPSATVAHTESEAKFEADPPTESASASVLDTFGPDAAGPVAPVAAPIPGLGSEAETQIPRPRGSSSVPITHGRRDPLLD